MKHYQCAVFGVPEAQSCRQSCCQDGFEAYFEGIGLIPYGLRNLPYACLRPMLGQLLMQPKIICKMHIFFLQELLPNLQIW